MRNLKLIVCVAALALSGCGLLFTELPPEGDDFESPLPNLPDDLATLFALGDENFERVFTPSDGLGPIFVEASCARCHVADGRGTTQKTVIRFSIGTDLITGLGGDQLQTRSIPGVPPESLPQGADMSARIPLPVFGMGLIEVIPEAEILSRADPNDTDADGISGRPNMVPAPEFVPADEIGGGPGLHVGRFGWKANRASLVDQVAHAYHQDMGVTNDFLPVEDPNFQAGGGAVGDAVADPELPQSEVQETIFYVRLLAPPARGDNVAEGEQHFTDVGCADCHTPTMTTGSHPIAALSNQSVHLYSDLLLHDMGDSLADNRPDVDANGREWRTKPLWGTRLVGDFLDGQTFFLHDGRATTLDGAIQEHGGEALASRDAYNALNPSQQAEVIAFLESL